MGVKRSPLRCGRLLSRNFTKKCGGGGAQEDIFDLNRTQKAGNL
jgi:hypothetical protein